MLGAFALTAGMFGGGAVLAVQPALASNNGVQLCAPDLNGNPSSPCADAYNNGGQLIASYAPGNSWEYIQLQNIGNGQTQAYDFNTGKCLGDFQNNPNDARVGDVQSCPSSGVAGWGTIFVLYSNGCPYGYQVHNNHWAGDMGGSSNNGALWNLNLGPQSSQCLKSYT